jgi:putative ABC transport system permease protein
LFGVSSVIAMLAVGEGASHEALEQIKSLGATNIMVRSKKPVETQRSSSTEFFAAVVYGLLYRDADQIRALIPQAEAVVSVRETPKDLRRGPYWSSSIVIGTSPEYLEVMSMSMDEGRWLTGLDLDRVDNFTVLGAAAAESLFPVENPIGQSVKAGDTSFTVIGVLDYLGRDAGPAGTPVDQCIFVPITTSQRRFGDSTLKQTAGSMEITEVELSEIKVKLHNTVDVIPAARVLRNLLEIGERRQDDVEINVPLELLRQEEETARIFNMVLGSIAVISLLVGGIGIMNVMLATVTERTREIGIRRALGARKSHIVEQFLVETAVLSGCGGLLGVGVGLLIPQLITAFGDTLTIVRAEHVLMALGISAGVGIGFGLYPAWRAANMDPVEALRHE